MSNNTTPKWQTAAWVAACVQVGIVSFSLFFIWSQLQQQKLNLEHQIKLSKAANTQTLAGLIAPLNLRITDPDMAELAVKGLEGINQNPNEQERKIQKKRFEHLLASTMIFYENVYSQRSEDLLDQKIYEAWDLALVDFLDAPGMAQFWNERKKFYRKDFSEHVDKIIACVNSTPKPAVCP